MTPATRDKLIAVLMEDILDEDLSELYEACACDADHLEQLIDDLEEQAYLRGKFEMLLLEAFIMKHWADTVVMTFKKP